ncbi:Sulfotransferase domain [Trinorchestia longiramus]|nr:Sulfotransferase domain [Trinorchestia longiramus]
MALSHRRWLVITGYIMTGVVGAMLLLYHSQLDVLHSFSAPVPLLAEQTPTHNLRVSVPPESGAKDASISKPARMYSSAEKNLLKEQRQLLDAKLQGCALHSSLDVKNKSELIPSEGGHPIQNLIVSTWRSGSSFLASVVSENVGTFLLYEPLIWLDISPKPKTSSLGNFIDELFHCNFTNKDSFFKTMNQRKWVNTMNKQFWTVCKKDVRTCITESYHEGACKLFPFVLIKTVRLLMNETYQLLENDNLNLRVLLLVRDPRASMASRYAASWCKAVFECRSEDYLCDFLESNYYSTKQLMAQFPGRVKVVRYEDIMLDPYTTVPQIYDFFRLTYGDEVRKLLQKEDRYSVNASVAQKRELHYWTEKLTFEQVSLIQSKCEVPLQMYGYKIAQNASHLLNLDPVDHFSLYPSRT